ncbi:SDR family NAD(P)-dependent oxidoreductase [Hirschia maritima]|uniref:SDR family NAD(P)-dependent oxidoreductase n=1 Tax=Hirschia maritima TaxID=1121961 RepID=UPI000364DAB6|nr:SDR family oxidoreductase [Hirschia maritima]
MVASPKTIVIIGGAKRIGEQCANLFVDNGWHVFLADTDHKALDAIKEELKDKVDTIAPPNISTNMALNNILSGALSAFGHIDSVCHIPDIPKAKKFSDTKLDEFDEKLLAPARAITAATRLFSDQMIRQMNELDPTEAKACNHSFIQVFALSAIYGDPEAYTQHASQSLALAAAKAPTIDLAANRIRTNAVVAVRPRAENEEPWLKQRTPLGRHSFAEEISETVLFLAKEGSANITGQSIVLDGGRSNLNGIYEKNGFSE